MIAIGSDHGGFELKSSIIKFLENEGQKIKDFGVYNTDSIDYPDIAYPVCKSIINGECDRGILICGTGIGVSIAANKIKGIRAALCSDCFSAKMAKQHNNANVICLGGRVIGSELAKEILNSWLNSEFGGGRHQRRIDKIHDLEGK